MAFIAGLLLMYLPEEPAYQLFCAVLGPGGAGMRAFFLPGLESLQTHVRCWPRVHLGWRSPSIHLTPGRCPDPLSRSLCMYACS